jgi:hypothetical protein
VGLRALIERRYVGHGPRRAVHVFAKEIGFSDLYLRLI